MQLGVDLVLLFFPFLGSFFFSFLFLFMGKLLSQRFDNYVCECMCVWWKEKFMKKRNVQNETYPIGGLIQRCFIIHFTCGALF